MNKLSLQVLQKLNNHTAAEIDFILYLAAVCNKHGQALVYYKKVMKNLNISHTKFYTLLRSLELTEENPNGLIVVDWSNNNKCFFDIKLLNNNYAKEDYSENPYINLNIKVLKSKEFINAKANVKLLILKLLSTPVIKSSGFKVSLTKLCAEWLDVSLNAVKKYLDDLQAWFFVTITNKIAKIKIKPVYTFADQSADAEHWTNFLWAWCKIHRVGYTLEDFEDILKMIKQYALDYCNFFRNLKRVAEDKKTLEPKLINWYIKNNK